jgi:hypothetical protein
MQKANEFLKSSAVFPALPIHDGILVASGPSLHADFDAMGTYMSLTRVSNGRGRGARNRYADNSLFVNQYRKGCTRGMCKTRPLGHTRLSRSPSSDDLPTCGGLRAKRPSRARSESPRASSPPYFATPNRPTEESMVSRDCSDP